MAERNTVTLSDSDRGLRAAAGLLRAGELVAFPTETVYGLGADARDDRAVAGIFAAKGRPAFNPLIVHVADLAAAERARRLHRRGPRARRALLARPADAGAAAPRRTPASSELATAGLPTVALRVPAHPLAQRLLAAFGGPLAAPSANPSGRVSPTTARARARRARRPHRRRARRRRLPGRARIDHRRLRGRSAGAAAPRRPAGRGDRRGRSAARSARRPPPAITAPGPARLALRARGAPLRLDAAAPRPGEVWLGFGPRGPAPPASTSRRPAISPRRPPTSSPTCARSTRSPAAPAPPASPWRRSRAPASASRSTTACARAAAPR